jgi:predicted 2-oxoglutarate/Fe(II)-dependent dioxygenase YbiX
VQIDDALGARAREGIRTEMHAATGEPASVLGSSRPSSARKSTRVAVSEAVRATVVGLLERLQPQLESHFRVPLDSVEAPQFLRYGPGDYFVAHQDGNTPLVHDESRFRKVTAVIFLSAPETYSGGSLVLHAEPPVTLAPAAGTLVAFPSETTHEVLPITQGERLSIVSWYRGSLDPTP